MDSLSFNTRKSLCNHLGERAGLELTEFLQQLKTQLEKVERNKVDVMRIVPESFSLSRNRRARADRPRRSSLFDRVSDQRSTGQC